jgi:ElaB/YqjD/DUF883 family membrane-anchored ribosome-binding protein
VIELWEARMVEQHKTYRPEERATPTVGDALSRGKEAAAEIAREGASSVGTDLEALRADLKSLRETVADLAQQAKSEAGRTAKDVSSSLASQVSGMAHDLADKSVHAATAARDQAKTAVGELESMARRNPLGALAGALFIGVLIGMSRRR